MMFYLYKISVFIHILSAIFWIGGMLFTVAVIVPATRHKVLRPQKGLFFAVMGKIFSNISWVLFTLLIITGYFQLWYRGIYWSDLTDAAFWQSHFGILLAYKLCAFAIVLCVSGLHDFWLGPKATLLMEKEPQNAKTKKYRKVAGWGGRLNLLLGLIILFLALSLVRG